MQLKGVLTSPDRGMAMRDFIALKQAAGEVPMKSEFEDYYKTATTSQMNVSTIF